MSISYCEQNNSNKDSCCVVTAWEMTKSMGSGGRGAIVTTWNLTWNHCYSMGNRTWNYTLQFGKLMTNGENERSIESSMESRCEWVLALLRGKILNIREGMIRQELSLLKRNLTNMKKNLTEARKESQDKVHNWYEMQEWLDLYYSDWQRTAVSPSTSHRTQTKPRSCLNCVLLREQAIWVYWRWAS